MNNLKLTDKNIPESLLDNIPIGIVLFDKIGTIYFVNKFFRDFEILYPDIISTSLTGKNVFSDSLIINKSLIKEINELKSGYPFELEIEEISGSGNTSIKLIIKGSPGFRDNQFDGGTLIIEDLKIWDTTKKFYSVKNYFLEKAAKYSNELFIIIDQDNKITFASGNTSLISSQNQGILSLSITELFDESSFNMLTGLIKQSHESNQVTTRKFTFEHIDPNKFIEISVIPQHEDKGNDSFTCILFRDISKSEDEINKLKEITEDSSCYSKVNEAAGHAHFTLDNENNILLWDKNCETIFGFNEEEVKNNSISKFIYELDDVKLSEIRAKLRNTLSYSLTIKINRKYEKTIYCVFALNKPGVERISVLCKDITEDVKTETVLNETIRSLSQLLSNANFLIIKTNESGNFLYANENFCETFDYSFEELKQKRLYDLIDPMYFENNIFDLRTAESSDSIKAELPFRKKNGDLLYLSITITPEKTNGNEQYYDCYIKDINEQKAKEKEALLYHSLLNASNDGIALGTDGKIVFANQAFAEIFNFETQAVLTGKDILDLVSGDDTLKVAEYFRLLERKKGAPSRFDFLGKKNDGTVFHSEISAGIFQLENKTHIVMIVRDVSERIRAQKAIRESEEKYRNITENIDDFLFTFERINHNLRPIFCTASVQKITGYIQTDFLSDGKLFLKIIHPDDFLVFKPKLMNLLKSRIQNSGEFEFRIINKHGNIVWVRTKLNLVRIGAGRIQKIFGLVSDITFRKRAEEELKKSTKNLIKLNETKDRFISIVSHDLRTPFSSILGFTDLLINDNELTEDEKKQYFRYIQDSSKSMLALVNSLLDWTRLQTGRIKFEPQKIDVVQIINDATNSISGVSIQKEVEIINLIKDERLIFADKGLVYQVFINLISNAVKFTNKGGKIYISSAPAEKPRFLEFSVKDTGTGIKKENLDKLFSIESKFTSEGTEGEKGSGLGLSLVREIIEKHNGKVWVKSEFGQGSDFRFTLPVASAKILIVDDNKTDRLLYSKILKNITPDYEVDVASNGKEALEKIESTHPALVITDHSMPIMNGYEFVIELQKLEMKGKPPVIVLSSDIDRNAINDYNGIGVEYVFQKPVNLGHFKQALEKSLRKSFTSN